MKRICFLNGKWLTENNARLSALDSGLLYGYGVFETIRIVNGKAFLLKEHFERLQKSLKLLGIKKIQYNLDAVVRRIIEKNNSHDSVVRITITAGEFTELPWLSKPGKPTVLVTIRELKSSHNIYQHGVKVVFIKEKDYGNSLALPGIKSTSYAVNVITKMRVKKSGAFEAIFVSNDGFLKEGASSNIFFIKNKKIYTPDLTLGILPGVTRGVVIKIIKKMGLKIKEGFFKINDFNQADEAFLTNSTFGMIPVAGKDKKIFNKIRERYESLY